jgi:hypothetical protein
LKIDDLRAAGTAPRRGWRTSVQLTPCAESSSADKGAAIRDMGFWKSAPRRPGWPRRTLDRSSVTIDCSHRGDLTDIERANWCGGRIGFPGLGSSGVGQTVRGFTVTAPASEEIHAILQPLTRALAQRRLRDLSLSKRREEGP